MTPEQQAAYDGWPAEQQTQYDAWPSEVQGYFWSLAPTRQATFWRLTDNDKLALAGMDEAQRADAWEMIDQKLQAESQPQ